MKTLLLILGSLTMAACVNQAASPQIDIIHPVEPILNVPADPDIQKRSRLPTPRRVQIGEVIIDPHMAQREKCDNSAGLPSAAHPVIKCGTRIHIVDTETNREAYAVVTHRLPLEGDRVLYISPRVGQELGIGTVTATQAKIEIIAPGLSYNPPLKKKNKL